MNNKQSPVSSYPEQSAPQNFYIASPVFDGQDAKKYGVSASILLHNIRQWTLLNKKMKYGFYEGKTWITGSIQFWSELFPFWTSPQIRKIFKTLIEKKAIITGRHNKEKHNQTLWYALVDENEINVRSHK